MQLSMGFDSSSCLKGRHEALVFAPSDLQFFIQRLDDLPVVISQNL
jgi:hypothetical protein